MMIASGALRVWRVEEGVPRKSGVSAEIAMRYLGGYGFRLSGVE